jgi:hypothetical protein
VVVVFAGVLVEADVVTVTTWQARWVPAVSQ